MLTAPGGQQRTQHTGSKPSAGTHECVQACRVAIEQEVESGRRVARDWEGSGKGMAGEWGQDDSKPY